MTFLDNDDDIKLDMGIFEEEDDDTILAEEATKTIELDGETVNTETGEVLETPEDLVACGLDKPLANPLNEAKVETVEKALEKPVELVQETVALDVGPKEEEGKKGKFHTPEAPADPALMKPPVTGALSTAMSLMDYRHVKELDPNIQFKDCDFGEFKEEVEEAQAIIDLYYEEGFEKHMGRMEFDMGKLSAIMTRVGRAVGFIQGSGEGIKDYRKAVEAGCYVELKELRDEHNLRVSDKDADKASRLLAAKATKKHVKMEIQSKMITNFWFSTRKFIDVLEGQVNRDRSAAKTEVHAEAAAHRSDPDKKPKIVEEHIADNEEEGEDFGF